MSSVAACARYLRMFNLSQRAWGHCRVPKQMVALAVRLFNSKYPSEPENVLTDEKRPEGVSLAGDIKAPLKHNADMSPTAALEGGSQEPGVTMQQTYDGVEKLMEEFSQRAGIQQAAIEIGVPEGILQRALQSFRDTLTDPAYVARHSLLQKLIGNILAGSAHIDDLFPYFMNHTREKYPAVMVVPQLQKISDLTKPHLWYPRARAFKRRFIFHAGPTNSGKTHAALKKFLGAQSAVYCAPLRMLAHEIYRRSNERGIPCDLLTGEEQQFASGDADSPSNHVSCTVEMVNLESYYDVAVVDEVQMIGDAERGGAWTTAILGLLAEEIHLCGHESALALVRQLADTTGDQLEVCRYNRLSPLVPLNSSLGGQFKSIQSGDCVVVFSREKLFRVRRKIETATKKSCAIIYGGLPSATRVQQAEIFNDSENHCEILVATDAIGMGLNLNIRRIILYDLSKYDGHEFRQLSSAHLKQIAGRAGRYGRDYDQGEVTTFYDEDLKKLHSLLSCPEEDIKKAGIYPTSEQVEYFSHLLPGASFLDILTLFFKMMQLDSTFFLCDVEEQLEAARHLQNLKIPLRDMYKMSLAPVSNSMAVLKEFATDYSHGKCVTYSRLCEIVGWPKRSPLSPIQLIVFERIHVAVDLYLWLSMRFPQCFVAADEARELQRTIEKEIARYIGKRSRPSSAINLPRHNRDRSKTRNTHTHKRTKRNREKRKHN